MDGKCIFFHKFFDCTKSSGLSKKRFQLFTYCRLLSECDRYVTTRSADGTNSKHDVGVRTKRAMHVWTRTSPVVRWWMDGRAEFSASRWGVFMKGYEKKSNKRTMLFTFCAFGTITWKNLYFFSSVRMIRENDLFIIPCRTNGRVWRKAHVVHSVQSLETGYVVYENIRSFTKNSPRPALETIRIGTPDNTYKTNVCSNVSDNIDLTCSKTRLSAYFTCARSRVITSRLNSIIPYVMSRPFGEMFFSFSLRIHAVALILKIAVYLTRNHVS